MNDDSLRRIAEALERVTPPRGGSVDWLGYPAYVWDGVSARAVPELAAPPLALMQGIDTQKEAVVANIARLAAGAAAHDMLLWGARGMGKSALLRSAVNDVRAKNAGSVAIVQAPADHTISILFGMLRQQEQHFLVFIDDLGFDAHEAYEARLLRSWLEGGIEERPRNVRLAVTSNRRAIVERLHTEQDDPINPRDAVDDRLALADRFGLSLGFHNCSQDDYLAIIAGYAGHYGLQWEEADALEWSKRRGARSGRVAWQYVTELAGRAGVAI